MHSFSAPGVRQYHGKACKGRFRCTLLLGPGWCGWCLCRHAASFGGSICEGCVVFIAEVNLEHLLSSISHKMVLLQLGKRCHPIFLGDFHPWICEIHALCCMLMHTSMTVNLLNRTELPIIPVHCMEA